MPPANRCPMSPNVASRGDVTVPESMGGETVAKTDFRLYGSVRAEVTGIFFPDPTAGVFGSGRRRGRKKLKFFGNFCFPGRNFAV